MNDKERTPGNYLPAVMDLFWLIGESPRGELILDEWWEGHATAHEIARALWPSLPPELASPDLGGTVSPAQWVESVLDHEARPCSLGGGGRIKKRGRDYVALRCEPKERPCGLPSWPSSIN